MPAGGAPMDGADRAENRGNMRARRGSVLTSKNSLIGAVPGAVAGALILFLFPGGLPLRILAAGLALLVGELRYLATSGDNKNGRRMAQLNTRRGGADGRRRPGGE